MDQKGTLTTGTTTIRTEGKEVSAQIRVVQAMQELLLMQDTLERMQNGGYPEERCILSDAMEKMCIII